MSDYFLLAKCDSDSRSTAATTSTRRTFVIHFNTLRGDKVEECNNRKNDGGSLNPPRPLGLCHPRLLHPANNALPLGLKLVSVWFLVRVEDGEL
jgi:hypothetical protein